MYVVTGAAGFIGSHLVDSLAADGHAVVGIDRRSARSPSIAHIQADLSVPNRQVDALLREADAVFHLAGCAGVRDHRDDVTRRRQRDNVVAGARVLSVTPPQTRVIVTSSSSVYGGCMHTGRPRPSRETDRLRPVSGYATSKASLERLCAQRSASGGRVAVARPFTVVGERQRPDMAVARWLAAVRAGRPTKIFGSPERTRDLTDVRGVVTGLRRMAERDIRGVVNLGSGVAHTLTEIVAAVCASAGTPVEIVVEASRAEELPGTLADTRRCADQLGFVPAIDLAAVVQRQARADIASSELVDVG